eukprot:sb/3470798/
MMGQVVVQLLVAAIMVALPHYTATAVWIPVTPNEEIPWDLENTPIEFKTDSTLGTKDYVRFAFIKIKKDGSSHWLTALWIHFSGNGIGINIGACSNSNKNIDMNQCQGYDRIWTVQKGEDYLETFCNGVSIFNYQFSDGSDYCREALQGDTVDAIRFATTKDANGSTAADFYRGLVERKYKVQTLGRFYWMGGVTWAV